MVGGRHLRVGIHYFQIMQSVRPDQILCQNEGLCDVQSSTLCIIGIGIVYSIFCRIQGRLVKWERGKLIGYFLYVQGHRGELNLGSRCRWGASNFGLGSILVRGGTCQLWRRYLRKGVDQMGSQGWACLGWIFCWILIFRSLWSQRLELREFLILRRDLSSAILESGRACWPNLGGVFKSNKWSNQ